MSAQDIIIRQATREDLTLLPSLLEILFSIETDFTCDPKRQLAGLRMLYDSPTSSIIVATQENQAIGMITGQLLISTSEGGLSLLVEDLVVAEEKRRRGIGLRLLLAMQQWGQDKGAGRIQLLADRNNQPALDFYLKNGWQKTQLICLRSFTDIRQPQIKTG